MPRKITSNLKTVLPKAQVKIPKPRIPGTAKPLGGGTGESNPPVTPDNSQKGIKQRVPVNLPGIKTY